ncbi:hypothetical protein COO60DRAFT_964827 [Scenedesmus sp. NREL 46B-D3]|nr:hypothetical protein COO60DRAFT_964827 [Scenedesmus sp. NREL 46B-D3]
MQFFSLAGHTCTCALGAPCHATPRQSHHSLFRMLWLEAADDPAPQEQGKEHACSWCGRCTPHIATASAHKPCNSSSKCKCHLLTPAATNHHPHSKQGTQSGMATPMQNAGAQLRVVTTSVATSSPWTSWPGCMADTVRVTAGTTWCHMHH